MNEMTTYTSRADSKDERVGALNVVIVLGAVSILFQTLWCYLLSCIFTFVRVETSLWEHGSQATPRQNNCQQRKCISDQKTISLDVRNIEP